VNSSPLSVIGQEMFASPQTYDHAVNSGGS
jgi:hypothetical protein